MLVLLALLMSCNAEGPTPTGLSQPATLPSTTAPTAEPAAPGAATATPPTASDTPPTGTATSPTASATSGAATAILPAASTTAAGRDPGTPANETRGAPPADSFPVPPERDLYKLAAELLPGPVSEERVVNPDPVHYEAGRQDTFWLVDLAELERYQSVFDLRLVTPHAYWYVEESLKIDQKDLEEAAAHYEDTIYPRITAVFGREWVPGVDNDPHLNVLNASLNLAGGYYSSSDEYPRSIRPNSNEREIIYINAAAIPVYSAGYLNVLAHELHHAIHWNADPSEESWVNEGLAELSVSLYSGKPASIRSFLSAGPTSLVHWPLLPVATAGSYGSASLFMHYLTEHYGDRDDLKALVRQPADGIAGVDAYLREGGYGVEFHDVFRDWAVATLLDEDQGRYSYGDIDVAVRRMRELQPDAELESQIPQYGTEYVTLTELEGPATLSFRGATETRLLPVDVGPDGCWWSNSGDSIDSTISRRLDLRGAAAASLQYEVWFNIEEGWDYGYFQVSTDGGNSWTVIETANTVSEDPIGSAYGPGYTGDSEGWTEESLSLDAYLGREVQGPVSVRHRRRCQRRRTLHPQPGTTGRRRGGRRRRLGPGRFCIRRQPGGPGLYRSASLRRGPQPSRSVRTRRGQHRSDHGTRRRRF